MMTAGEYKDRIDKYVKFFMPEGSTTRYDVLECTHPDGTKDYSLYATVQCRVPRKIEGTVRIPVDRR